MSRLQHFGWFLARGFGPHGWGHPYLRWNHRWTEPGLYQDSARTLEHAGFDLLIIEDAPSLGSAETIDLRVRHAFGGPKHDPLLLAPYLFAATQHLGVVPTVNPAAYLPYTAARQFATLQHLSGHRLGLNVVTDTGSARHFSTAPQLGHDAAYDRAEQWIDGLRDLWRSWGDGALVEDEESGVYADGTRLSPTRHRGEYFGFDGPLNAVPFTDGEPAIVSPGGSGRGLAFAGRNSDVQLALAPLDEQSIRAYRARIHAAAEAAGRTPDDVKILFAIQPVLVSSAEEADRLVAASADPDDAALLAIARFGDAAFQHNGALVPADRLRAELTAAERATLRGSNDSELYFARLRRALTPGTDVDPTRIAEAVAAVRTSHPDACLNALLLTPDALVAVHSSAGRPAPLAAFAARGLDVTDLPPGHGADYNRLFTRRTASGARLVTTTGIPLDGWTALPDDTVSLVTPDAVASVPLPRAPRAS